MAKPKWYNWAFPITNIGRLGELGGKGGGADSIPLEPDKLPEQLRVSKELSDYISKYLPGYEPGKEYTGERTADLSTPEQRSLELLDKYLGGPATGETFGLGEQEIRKTLTGDYDPRTSLFYNALKDTSRTNLNDELDLSRRAAGARGSYFTEGAMRDESRLRERNLQFLNNVLGDLFQSERDKRFQAAPIAQSMDAYKTSAQVGQVQAGQQYGALPRLVGQADLEAKYQDFLRQQQERGTVPGQAQSYFGTPVTFGMKNIPLPQQPSALERILGVAAPIAGAAAGTFFGGPAGGMAGYQLGSGLSQAVSGGGRGGGSFGDYSLASSPYAPKNTAYYLNYMR